jgi:hypothetical protein
MAYDILEVASIPRERDKLRGLLGEARYHRRIARIQRVAALVIMVLAVVLLFWSCSMSNPGMTVVETLYLPLVAR